MAVFMYDLSSWSSWAEEVYIFTGIMSFEYRINNETTNLY